MRRFFIAPEAVQQTEQSASPEAAETKETGPEMLFRRDDGNAQTMELEEYLVGAVLVVGVAVYALMVEMPVLYNRLLTVRSQLPLVDTHFVPELIARVEQTIGQVGVNGVFREVIGDVGITHPLP